MKIDSVYPAYNMANSMQSLRQRMLYYTAILTVTVLTVLSPGLNAQGNTDTNGATGGNTPDTATLPADMDRATGPGSAVRLLHAALLEVMKNSEELGYDGRYEKLLPVIRSVFDTPLISKVILSRYWKDLSEVQRSEFIDLFTRLSTATYASRFDGYNGEEFLEIEVKELQKGRQLVKTELQRKDKKAVKLDYLVHRSNGKWRIISVIADGVNDLSLKRAEYAVVIKDKGYHGLLKDIQSKIDDMESDS